MSDELTIDDRDVLDWFESADLAQAITTHAVAQGILRQREKQKPPRKRRTDRKKADRPLETGMNRA